MTSLAPMHCNSCFEKVLLQALWREVLGLEMWWKYCEDIDGTLWKGKGYQHFYIVESVRYKDINELIYQMSTMVIGQTNWNHCLNLKLDLHSNGVLAMMADSSVDSYIFWGLNVTSQKQLSMRNVKRCHAMKFHVIYVL